VLLQRLFGFSALCAPISHEQCATLHTTSIIIISQSICDFTYHINNNNNLLVDLHLYTPHQSIIISRLICNFTQQYPGAARRAPQQMLERGVRYAPAGGASAATPGGGGGVPNGGAAARRPLPVELTSAVVACSGCAVRLQVRSACVSCMCSACVLIRVTQFLLM
jgi:hypothetical protein